MAIQGRRRTKYASILSKRWRIRSTAGSGHVRMGAISACTDIVCHPGMPLTLSIHLCIYLHCSMTRLDTSYFYLHMFVLKTREKRAAEKALMDKSPLKTLTLEDWLESERHKLTGTLTPVTSESFAKWKKERLDK